MKIAYLGTGVLLGCRNGQGREFGISAGLRASMEARNSFGKILQKKSMAFVLSMAQVKARIFRTIRVDPIPP